ncbi:hypothetical protein S40293_10083 [Stachybotrys chartarum IBT 40293]|nr:hypothetical protein S40293_10083 [Stachybotrys chartarum IBT 40293]
MPLRPRYSRGCFACRRMKVKCDEQKPQCRRCLVGRRKCPGFPEVSNFVFMNADCSVSSSRAIEHSPAAERARSPSVVKPSTDWEQHAIAYFLDNFVLKNAQEETRGYLQFLPGLILTRGNEVCLRDALLAVSMTSLANISSNPTMRLRSAQLYGQALRSTSAALDCHEPGNNIPLLAAILLLQKRDTLAGDLSVPDPHGQGLIQLVSARAMERPESTTEHGLLHTIHARLRMSNLGAKDPRKLTLFVPNVITKDPEARIWALIDNVSDICRDLHALATISNGCHQSRFQEVMDRAFIIEVQLRAWSRQLSQTQAYSAIDLMPGFVDPSGLQFAEKVYTYTSMQEACHWVTYWSGHMVLLSALLDSIHLAERLGLGYTVPQARDRITTDLLGSANAICSSVPFMLGEIDTRGNPLIGTKGKALGAYFLTRFLAIISETTPLPKQQRLWTLDCLSRIGYNWGIGAAFSARTKCVQMDGFHTRPNLPSRRKTVIENVRVFDGRRLRPPSSVVIDGDIIGRDADGATERIDGQGGVLLPGFIESHSHPQTIEHMNLLTGFGVTTAFHMACYSTAHCLSLQNHRGLVDIHWGTTPATAFGSAVGSVILNLTSDPSLLIHNDSDATRWSDQQMGRNPEFFKLAASNPGLSQGALTAVVEYAHQHGRNAVCHAADQASHLQAHLSGADQIHHTPLDVAIDSQLAHKVFARGQVCVPTLSVMKAFADLMGANYAAARESLRVYYEARVPILAGTDANTETPATVPFGSSFHSELELMVEAGMSTVDVLRSATVLPAKYWGLSDRGVIALGKRADLILIGGDPLVDINTTRDIKCVWVAGDRLDS